MVVLSTQMEITEKNGRLGASNDEDNEDQEKEAVHIINLTAPDTVENKEELDENTSKGENSTHNDARNGLSINRLIRNLSGNLVGSDWLFYSRLPESKVSSYESKRHGDAEPKGQKSYQSEEWNGCRRSVVP